MTRCKKILMALLLELFAVVLAFVQFGNGVQTDEAKYLLNIPYPHPPLARFILHLNQNWIHQELFWRIIFATLLVQAVWILLRLVQDLKQSARVAVAASWLLSTGVLFQAGTVMMAPLTALEALFFIYLLLRDDETVDMWLIATVWLVSLFTAYQAVLFAPIVCALILRSRVPLLQKIAAFAIPLLLLFLYTLSNPLALASITIHATKDVSDTIFIRLAAFLRVWFLGGSVVVSLVGLYGIIRARAWPLIGSFLLVSAYVLLARFDYYAILFMPLSVAGVILLLRKRQLATFPFVVLLCLCSVAFALRMPPVFSPSPARRTMQMIDNAHIHGPLFISGSFGHNWQYESSQEIVRFNAALLSTAGAVICTSPCTAMDARSEWAHFRFSDPAVYVLKNPSDTN